MSRCGEFLNAPETPARREFEADKTRLAAALGGPAGQAPPALSKTTSNLFRPRDRRHSRRLPRVGLNRVLRVEPEGGWAEVGGMTPYETFVRETLPFGQMPAVVPELKSITVGGALAGGGVESSSFRHGYAHETALAFEIATARGEVVFCTPHNEHRDLFYGFANSYGTLGYLLRAWMRIIPVKPFVRLRHLAHPDPRDGLERLAELCAANREPGSEVDFIEACWFGDKEGMVITTGAFTDRADRVSNYTGMRIYHRSILRKTDDCLSVSDYLWRWDTDWFWCSRAFGMENPLVRAPLAALGLLRSTTYWKLRAFLEKTGLLALLLRLRPAEFVIQDVEIPARNAAAFLDFFNRRIGILPVWICPAKSPDPAAAFSLFEVDPRQLYFNFGFWGSVPGRHPDGFHNRLIEETVRNLAGKKSLYSTSHFPEKEFWEIYNRPAYEKLKRRYDPDNRLRDLHAKCVRGL